MVRKERRRRRGMKEEFTHFIFAGARAVQRFGGEKGKQVRKNVC